MSSQSNSRRYRGDYIEQAGEMTTRVRYERGEDPLDVLGYLTDVPDAAIAAAKDAISNVFCECVGIAVREFVLGPLPPGQSRRRKARHLRCLTAVSIEHAALPGVLDKLQINAQQLAVADSPSILLIADAIEAGQDLDDLAFDRLIS